ncbi:cell envelope-related function transcriptional attenuator common domain-containing protein [Amycolatopsis arida]|uniref:Cell envelope-related function transcriptional attenuator common domain-containing protein n=1 Tax=Amycolatopsis arida TaxID=587909 RepID=A0A1I5WMF3_9PSEU|nr:LCP family protein [Amycolatopsis arida]TDX92342.1 LCP family protein required for cell wall assembly [Amycolatopsis arida]SFQ20566.1 cell envelope-related function transcriptional attenuator common domain-containing protein [Amycolatopsis arida]
MTGGDDGPERDPEREGSGESEVGDTGTADEHTADRGDAGEDAAHDDTGEHGAALEDAAEHGTAEEDPAGGAGTAEDGGDSAAGESTTAEDHEDYEDHTAEGGGGAAASPRRFVPSPHPRSAPPASESRLAEPARSRRGRRAGHAVGRVLLALLSAVALVATGYAYTRLDDLRDNVHTTDALDLHDEDPVAPPADDGATDILLVGTDARTDMQGNPLPLDVLRALRTESKAGINTDTLILLRVPKDGGRPTGVSIPRDTWVSVPQGGHAKINSVYGVAKAAAAERLRREGARDQAAIERESDQAGRRALVKTVQEFTQVRIDHYAEVGLLGFYLLTEALGGVKVCLRHATEDKDSGADFRAGPQVVSGGEALSFVRQRKNLPRGDLDRIVRQQAFLASALHQVLSAGTLTNPGKLDQLTDAVHRSLVTDPDLDLLKFAEQAKDIASGDIEFVTIPVVTVGARSEDGQSIVEVNLAEVRRFIAGLVPTDSGATGAAEATAGVRGGGGAAGSNGAGGGAARQITAEDVPCVN